jgi:glycosyltransferase involved in cell wall biosynthesis
MGSPVVSVVMSAFNGKAFLFEAIESILSQTYTQA